MDKIDLKKNAMTPEAMTLLSKEQRLERLDALIAEAANRSVFLIRCYNNI